MLIPVLLLISLMLILCMAELGRQPYQYGAARRAILSAQARTLAESGLRDFQTKWAHDLDFPPALPEGSERFSYEEEVRDWQSGQLLGYYRVNLDAQWRWAPYRVLQVTSQGIVGPSDNPTCLYVIDALLDIEPDRRTGAGSNPFFGRWIEWRESAL